jgi:heme exporter protein D
MHAAWQEAMAGWKDVRWAVYFAILLLPALAIALGLSFAISGRLIEPPNSVTWTLAGLAAFVSLYWAGLWDGFDGRFGRYVWVVTLVAVAWWLIRSLMRQASAPSAPGQRLERTTRLKLARHRVTLTVSGQLPKVRFLEVGQTIRRQLWRPAEDGVERGVLIGV